MRNDGTDSILGHSTLAGWADVAGSAIAVWSRSLMWSELAGHSPGRKVSSFQDQI